MSRTVIILYLLFIVGNFETTFANGHKDSYQIYFICVGSEAYIASDSSVVFNRTGRYAFKPFNNASDAAFSAEEMKQAFVKMGASFGILLRSKKSGAYVGKEDIKRAIIDLKRRIRNDNPKNPIIIFYYIGHGIGDSVNRYLYLVPGNFCPNGDLNQTNTIRLLKTCTWGQDIIMSFVMFRQPSVMSFWDDVYMSDLMPDLTSFEDMARVGRTVARMTMQDELNRATGKYPQGPIPSVPYIVLFDNCYGGIEEDLTRSGSNKELKEVFTSLKRYLGQTMNSSIPQIEDGGLVLYAAEPGKTARAERHPFPPNGEDEKITQFFIGPIARRFLKIQEDSLKRKSLITIGEFWEKIRSAELDRDTIVPTTYSAPKPLLLQSNLFNPGLTANHCVVEERNGTSFEPVSCCGKP
nr:hypothetical protein [uncultured Desulfobacter sp.]